MVSAHLGERCEYVSVSKKEKERSVFGCTCVHVYSSVHVCIMYLRVSACVWMCISVYRLRQMSV